MGMFPDWEVIYAKFDILVQHLETLKQEVVASRKAAKTNTEATLANTVAMNELAKALNKN